MDNNNQITFGLRFSKINVLRYSQYDIADLDVNRKVLIEYQNTFQLKVIKESSEVAILSIIKLFLTETNELFAELKVECFFEVNPFDVAIKLKNNNSEFEVPNDLLIHLTSLSVGTVRGILHEKLKGTPLQNEVLPLINPKELLSKETKNK